MAALLDVNVLLALAWRQHVHHEAADQWFAANRRKHWATCVWTQAAFVRISCQPAIAGRRVSPAEALRVLADDIAAADHEFWPLERSLVEILPEIRSCLIGPQQVMDALLLDLAIHRHGKLATLDRRLTNLLPVDSPYREVIEILPAE